MIRIAIIGAGHWGPNLIRNFHNKVTSEVAWVADQVPARLERAKAVFPDIGVTTSGLDAIRDPKVDAVVVATPTSTHYPLTKAALEAGKHVLVEKPITHSVAHAEEIAALAESKGVTLLVGHVFLFNNAIQRTKKYLDEKLLGDIHYISAVRTNLGPIRMDVSAAWDLASHDISIVNYWLGTTPVTVSALGGEWINPGIADAVFVTARYPGNIIVNLHASWLNPRKARDITVVGSKKMLTFDDMNLSEPLRIFDKQVTDERVSPSFTDSFASFRASVREGDITSPRVTSGEPLKNECDHFLECIIKRSPALCGAREGLAVVRTLEAIARSAAANGREERV